MGQKIYLASSWRNARQPEVLATLRAAGHEVYDFRDPVSHFRWDGIDADWEQWTTEQYLEGLKSPKADFGFNQDFGAMEWADVGVLLLPCGRSAHLEAGYFVGAGKRLVIALEGQEEPELMYKMADVICKISDVVEAVASLEVMV